MAYHDLAELRKSIGEKVFVASKGMIGPKRANALRCEEAELVKVARVKVTLEFPSGDRWRWPADQVVLRSHPQFEHIIREQERLKLDQDREDRRRMAAAAAKRRETLRRRREHGSVVPRDSQRSKVYAWERAHVDPKVPGGELSFEECQAWVQEVLDDLGENLAVTVVKGRGNTAWWSTEWRGGGTMSVPKSMRTKPVLLHELAHGLCWQRFGETAIAAHGPEFVRTYIGLLVRYLGLSTGALEASARIGGVRVAEDSGRAFLTRGERLARSFMGLGRRDQERFLELITEPGSSSSRAGKA